MSFLRIALLEHDCRLHHGAQDPLKSSGNRCTDPLPRVSRTATSTWYRPARTSSECLRTTLYRPGARTWFWVVPRRVPSDRRTRTQGGIVSRESAAVLQPMATRPLESSRRQRTSAGHDRQVEPWARNRQRRLVVRLRDEHVVARHDRAHGGPGVVHERAHCAGAQRIEVAAVAHFREVHVAVRLFDATDHGLVCDGVLAAADDGHDMPVTELGAVRGDDRNRRCMQRVDVDGI